MLIDKYYKGVQFREDIPLKIKSDGIQVSGRKSFKIEGFSEKEILFFKQLKAGIKASDLDLAMKSSKLNKILIFFDKEKFLQHLYYCHEKRSESRQLKWMSVDNAEPDKELKKLQDKKIGILGCGGTGAIMAMHLARSGVKHFILVDGAKIDGPDMNRQLAYTFEDIGKPKVSVLKNYLKKTAQDLTIQTSCHYVESADTLIDIFKDVDLILSCADKPFGKIHQIVTQTAIENQCPVLFGGIGFDAGTVGPLLVSKLAKKNYLNSITQVTELWEGEHNILEASLCHTNSIISTLMGYEAFQFLRPSGTSLIENQSFDYHFATGRRENVTDWESVHE